MAMGLDVRAADGSLGMVRLGAGSRRKLSILGYGQGCAGRRSSGEGWAGSDGRGRTLIMCWVWQREIRSGIEMCWRVVSRWVGGESGRGRRVRAACWFSCDRE